MGPMSHPSLLGQYPLSTHPSPTALNSPLSEPRWCCPCYPTTTTWLRLWFLVGRVSKSRLVIKWIPSHAANPFGWRSLVPMQPILHLRLGRAGFKRICSLLGSCQTLYCCPMAMSSCWTAQCTGFLGGVRAQVMPTTRTFGLRCTILMLLWGPDGPHLPGWSTLMVATMLFHILLDPHFLNRSQIPRLYHSCACLTTNGTILVAGSEPTGAAYTNLTYSRSKYNSELRMEIFYPPFWFANDKPQITSVSSSNVTYNQTFNISFSGSMVSETSQYR